MIHRVGGGRHVGAFADTVHAVVGQRLGIGQGQLVLGGAGEGSVGIDAPDSVAVSRIVFLRDISCLAMQLGVLDQRGTLDFLEPLEGLEVNATRIVNGAAGVAAGDRLGAQLIELLDGIDCHVARAGDQAGLATQIFFARSEHVLSEVDSAVAGGFLASQRATPAEALAGQDAFIAPGNPLVLAV